MIDAAALVIACFPLGLYLLVLGWMNLQRQPTVISGVLDAATLAAAVSGMMAIGPLSLFLPEAAAARFGPTAWGLLLAFYFLCVVLYLLLARPRLVIFNVTREKLWPVLEQVARRLDADAKLAGDAVQLPQLKSQFHLETNSSTRNLTLVATGDEQSYSTWKRLRQELAAGLRGVAVPRNPRGFTFIALGLFLLSWPAVQLLRMPGHAVAQMFWELLRM